MIGVDFGFDGNNVVVNRWNESIEYLNESDFAQVECFESILGV